jgi:thiosulfate/3-mercaptopyruvate sulfurtransferase
MAVTLALPGPLVDAAWLAAHLDEPSLRVFDATKFLPTEGRDGQAEFNRAHIPGAGFFEIDLFADPDTDLPHMAPSQGRFARLAGAAGIGNESVVVFYDQKGQASAARGWWLMRLFGHRAVSLLDGGLPLWIAGGHPTLSGPPDPPQPATFAPHLEARWLTGLGDVLATLGTPHTLVLDARPAARFAGTAAEPRPGLARGHIPFSRSLPAGKLTDANDRFLAPEQLRALFEQAGVDGHRSVVTTCGTGVTASTLAFALHLAGLPDASVYDGSWAEWGSRPDTPQEVTP